MDHRERAGMILSAWTGAERSGLRRKEIHFVETHVRSSLSLPIVPIDGDGRREGGEEAWEGEGRNNAR